MTRRRYLNAPVRHDNPWRIWDPPSRESWQNRAACRGDGSLSWFTPPGKLSPHELRRLALTCRDCPVSAQCHTAAVGERATVEVTRAGSWWRGYRTHRDETPMGPAPWAEEYLRVGRLPPSLFFTHSPEEGTAE